MNGSPPADPQPAPWRLVESTPLADCRIFKVRRDHVISPRTQAAHDMFVLEQPDWVNVIPLTANNDVVMVRQWRHGTRTIELETPGGLIDANESPLECARRELIEETGYRAGHLVLIGQGHPNPAIQNNRQFYVLATGCTQSGAAALDSSEDVAVELVPLDHIAEMTRAGTISHLIVIAAFYFVELYQRGGDPRGLP